MSPTDLEELYLTTIRAPVVILLFLSLWGVVMIILQALRIDYNAVLLLPKLEERPRASHRQVLGTAGSLLVVFLTCLYAGERMMRAPNIAVGAFYIFAGMVLALQTRRCMGDNVIFFSRVLWLVALPGHDVHFAEVFVADALTSLNRVIADAGCALTLLMWSWTGGDVYPPNLKVAIRAMLMALPYCLRVRQCRMLFKSVAGCAVLAVKKWNEPERRRRRLHLINIAKYLSALPLISLSALEAVQPPGLLRQRLGTMAATAAVLNSSFCFGWDVKMDWGLAQPGSKRPGLRNTTLLSRASWPYYSAVALDAVLRMVWVVKYWATELPFTDLVLVLEIVEVCRRSVWNLFRLEWEVIQSAVERGATHHHQEDHDDRRKDISPSSSSAVGGGSIGGGGGNGGSGGLCVDARSHAHVHAHHRIDSRLENGGSGGSSSVLLGS